MNSPATHTPRDIPVSESEARRRGAILGFAFALLTAAMLIASFTMQALVLVGLPQYATAWWMSWILSLAPLYVVALPCLLVVLRRVPAAPHNTAYRRADGLLEEKPPFRTGHWLIVLVVAFGCLYGGGLLGNATMWLLSSVTGHDYANSLETMVEGSPVWMTVLCACVIAPLGEELIFRKLLLDRARFWGDLPAILLSGLLFGLFHGNLFQFFYAFTVGVLLAYLYTRSGRYLWCVAAHALLNLMGSVVVPELTRLIPEASAMTTPGLLLTIALAIWQYGSIAAAVVLLIVLWKRRKLSPGSLMPGGRPASALLYLNPGMIGCLLIMLMLMASNLILPLIPV